MPERFTRECVDVVEVDDAIGGHVITRDSQIQLGDEPSARSRQRRDDDGADAFGDGIPRQNKDGPVAS